MTLPLIVATLCAAGTGSAPEASCELAPKAYRTWPIELPADPFRPVSGAFAINGPGSHKAEVHGVGLNIDTDGDGVLDRVVEGREHPETKIREARVMLTAQRADGSELRYPVRLQSSGKGWTWAAGGALVGQIGDTRIEVIDLDGDGRHGDIGKDAVVVGGTGIAQFLGETVAIDGELHTLAIDGHQLSLGAYAGESGLLDLHSEFDGKGVLLSAVVKSLDGRHSFELSQHEDGLKVPVGEYNLVGAALGLGAARVTVETDEMAPMEVTSGEETALEWGAPIRATFQYAREGDQVVLDPSDVHYVGAAGERWIGWSPIGKSPKFEVKEKNSGDVLVDVVFPGSC